MPLRLSPLRIEGPTGADSTGAWALFDRDTATRWTPSGADVELELLLDAPRSIIHLKVFGPGQGELELEDEDGKGLASVDLAGLRAGWNQVAVAGADATKRLGLRVRGATAVPDVEVWAWDVPRPILETERLLEELAYSRLEGLADVVAAQQPTVTLDSRMGCGDIVFELPRDPSVYRRTWISYGATGMYRPFVVTRALNDGPALAGHWVRGDMSVGVFVDPIDPERLVPGTNWVQVCLPDDATGSTVVHEARFIGELDHGTNFVEGVGIGTAGLIPTQVTPLLLEPANIQPVDVAPEQQIVLAFERWISPDAILLVTDLDAWQVSCLDRSGVASPLTTRSFADEGDVAIVIEPGAEETMCAGLALQPSGKGARVRSLAVTGSGARHRIDWPRIVLASPREHFGRVAWVDGWAEVPPGVTGDVQIAIDGLDTGTTRGVYGQVLERTGSRAAAWPVQVTALLPDGTSATREFVLTRYSDTMGLVENALGDPGTPLTEEESAERYGAVGASVSQSVDPDADNVIRLGTHVGVDIPAGAVNGNGTTVTITHLDASAVPPLDPGLFNVTAPSEHAYEFLPHGKEFNSAVTVLLPFDEALLPPGFTPDDVHAYFFDTDKARWVRLTRKSVDAATGTTRSDTDHFTTMINAVVVAPEHSQVLAFNPTEISGIKSGNPGARINVIDPPGVSPQGDASLSYTLDVPPGRVGIQPALSISYASSKGNGWLGIGWDLAIPAVTIDTRFGAPRYDATVETETYMANGGQLTPFAHRGPPRARTDGTTTIGGETVKIFHARVEGSFAKIIRHGNHPSNYWWESIDKNGTRYFYGGDPETGVAADSTLVTASGNIFHWALREMRDTHGNFVRYCTERVQDVGLASGTVPGWELYLASIDYTRGAGDGHSCTEGDRGPYRVVFKRDSHVGAPRRPDVPIDGRGGFKRVTAERLRRIEVFYGAQLVRAWDLDYQIGAFHKSLLSRIQQRGVDNVPFPENEHTFEYFDEVRSNPTGAPQTYNGFAGAQAWSVPGDDIDTDLIVPSSVLGLFGPDEPSLLGGGTGRNIGGHLYIGFNPLIPSKTGSFGGKVGVGFNQAKGAAAFLDVDGDGLPDKLFRSGSGFVHRRNLSGPNGTPSFSGSVSSLPGLPDAISRDNSFMFSAGVEAYPFVFGLIFNHSETFSRTSTYISDVNGDGLPDLVSGGAVLFNRKTPGGGNEFTGTSAGTPFPIVPGSVETDGLIPDYQDAIDAANDANPLVDTVRFWVAPLAGHVDITAPVQLTQPSTDGVRVAIQLNDTELWSEVIAGGDLSVKVPTGVTNRFVTPGDRIYFRVNSRSSGLKDEVSWSPNIEYNDLADLVDANGLETTEYSAAGDFILGGSSASTVTPFDGTVRLQGTMTKAVTSDDVTFEIRRDGFVVFTATRAWDSTTPIAIDTSFAVDREDRIELLVRADSPIDLGAIDFSPVVEMIYTAAFDADGNPVTVTDPSGNPIIRVYPPYDMDIYSVTVTGLGFPTRPTAWVAPASWFPMDVDTVNVRFFVSAALPLVGGPLTFTAKDRVPVGLGEQPELLVKHAFSPVFVFPAPVQTFDFTVAVVKDRRYFFDFSSRDRDVALGSDTVVTAVREPLGAPLFVSVPHTFNTVVVPDLCTRPYRGWSYAGYVPEASAIDDPIRHSGMRPFCSAETDFDEGTAVPDNQTDLENSVASQEDSVTRAFAPFPGGRPCAAGPVGCQIPAGRLWGGPGELSYLNPGRMSSSRQQGSDTEIPTVDDIAGVGATAVARVSRTRENAISVSGGVGPLNLSGSIAEGQSSGEVDFLDMNGDSFPDVVSHSGIQYTDPRGTLAERRPVVDNVRESDSIAISAGIGGTVARSVASGKGRFGVTGENPGTTAESDNQMAELGFSLDANANINTSDVNEELMDINGDGLPDRLTRSGSSIFVEFNLGYGFTGTPERWDTGSTINTANSASLGGGASLSFNDGNYGFGGGINIATSFGRINEYVDAFQRDGQSLADVNGDGLVDRVVASGGTLQVRFNTGNGFASGSTYSGLQGRDISENKTATAGAGGYFTISIGPICLVACYIIINPGGDVSESLQRPEAALQDVNGDGYPDHLVSEDDGELTASLNNHGRTNLLRKVRRPLNADFDLDYARTGNTFEQPQSRWVLSRVTVFDGLAGDGTDYQVTSYGYGQGFYDRFEREFYGFAEVMKVEHDTRGIAPGGLASAPPYRGVRREFYNGSFFLNGLLRRETEVGLEGGVESVYKVSEHDYLLRDLDSGLETADPSVLRFTLSSVFPQLVSTIKRVSEGDGSVYLETQTAMSYDAFGNVATLTDTGDVGSADDVTATITYTGVSGGSHASCATRHIVGIADSIVVRDAAGLLLRRRSADIDCTTGDMIRLERTIDGSAASVSEFVYAADGNLTRVVGAPNHRGQRYTLDFAYDPEIRTHVAAITDSFGTSSEAHHDLRFGEPDSHTDTNGNTITRTYDAFGRVVTITGPYEQGSGFPTITFEYHPEAPVPYARTRNLDPFRDLGDPIDTIVFIDGIQRMVQTKKDITVHRHPAQDPIDRMVVSGRRTSDHVGRAVEMFYPRLEDKNDAINLQYEPTPDTVNPTRTDVDVRDRVTRTTFPDGTTRAQTFELAPDRHGILRARVTLTDALSNRKLQFTDVRQQQVAVLELNVTKGEEIWTEYAYDPMQQLVGIVDDHGNRTTLGYDLLGRRTSIDNPDTGLVEIGYDAADNMIQKVTGQLREAGEAITYEYDFNRRIAIKYPLFPENDVTYEYGGAELRGHGGNRVGRVTRVTDESGTEDRLYGKLGEIIRETKTIASDTLGACAACPEVWVTEYTYDTWGRLQQMVYPDTEVLDYDYDSGGLVRAVTGTKLGVVFEYVTRLEYDKFEKRAYMAYGNGVETTYEFDAVDRSLTQLVAGTFQNLHYEYDDVGNILRVENQVEMRPPNEMGGPVDQVYEYDSLYRLTRATGSFRYGPFKTNAYELSLDYDTIHNILSKTQNHTVQTKTNNPVRQHKTTYDWTYEYESGRPHAASRIGELDYFYDASGNQLGWDDSTSGQRRTIVWDEENRIQEVADNGRTTRYKYDDGGERVIKRGPQGETAYINQYWTARNRSVGTKHIFVGQSRLVSKLSPGERHVNPGIDDPFFTVLEDTHWNHEGEPPGPGLGHLKPHKGKHKPNPDTNFVYYYHSDHLGSTGWVTDFDGELYEHVEYFPFGEPWVREDSNTQRTPYLFTSKELDEETELYYFGARYYDPRTSMWLAADPELVDEPGITVNKPNFLAAYTYTELNPLRIIDPDGRQPKERTGLLAGVAKWLTTSDVANVISYVPVVGDVMDFATAGAYFYLGDNKMGAVQLGIATVGLIPFGDAAKLGKGVVKNALEEGGERAAREGAQALGKKSLKEALSTEANQAVFWSGIRGSDSAAAEWAAKNGGVTLEQALKRNGIELPKWDPSNPATVQAWRDASAEFAKGAKGDVRVLMPGGTPRAGSVFGDIELPALRENPAVKSITAINPETGKEVLLWAR